MYSRADVQRGQTVWQSTGGMQQGSVWGHGGYLAPDWTADWLQREAQGLLARITAAMDRARSLAASATGPAKVYSAGEGFFEPPGSMHTISENASNTEPASLLAIFVADDGAQLTRGATGPK